MTSIQEQLQIAIDAIPEAFVLWDSENRLVLCNSKFQELHNLPDSVIAPGTPYETVVAASRKPVVHKKLENAEEARTFEARLNDGRWLHISEQRTKDGGYVSVSTDITALKLHEEKLLEGERRQMAVIADLRAAHQALKSQTLELADLAQKYADEKRLAEEALAAKIREDPIYTAIPDQVSIAARFTIDKTGQIDIIPDPPDGGVVGDEFQDEVYAEVRRKAVALCDLGHNQLGDLSGPANRFLTALPEASGTISIIRIWSRGNTLRRRLQAHLAVKEISDPARLPPLVAASLDDLVETYNIFIVGDPKGRELDHVRLGPQERKTADAVVATAIPVAEAVRKSGIATPAAVEVLTEQIDAAKAATSSSGIYSDQAVELAKKTSSNFVVELLRSSYRFLRGEAAFGLKETRAGVYRAGGAATFFAGATFVVTYAPELKAFVTQAFHNPTLLRIIEMVVKAIPPPP
jgi:hypothetical protein